MFVSVARHHSAKHLYKCAQLLRFSISLKFKNLHWILVSVRLYLVHLDSACLNFLKMSARNSVEHIKKSRPWSVPSLDTTQQNICSNVHNYFLRIKIKTLVYLKKFLEQTKGYMINIIDWDAPTHQKKKIATWLIFSVVVRHTLHQEDAHSCSQHEILYITTTKKRYQYTHTTFGSLSNHDDDGNKNPTNLHNWQWKTVFLHASHVHISSFDILKTFSFFLRREMTCFADVWTTSAYDDKCSILSSYAPRACSSCLLKLPIGHNTLTKRNFYQGCKWSSPADTSTGPSHLPNRLLKGISIRVASDQVQLIPKPVRHTYPALY